MQIKETLKFDILPPNTVLADQNQDDVPICSAIISGDVRVFKKDSDYAHDFPHDHALDRAEQGGRSHEEEAACGHGRVQDRILGGGYGRLVTHLSFNDMTTTDSKVFIGFDPSWQTKTAPNTRSEYTFITSATELTVVFKSLPDQLKEMLRYEKRCLDLMQERRNNFLHCLDKIRWKAMEGERQKTALLYPVQVQKPDFTGNEKRFQFAMPQLKATVKHLESRVEQNLVERMTKKERTIEEASACARIPG